MGVRRNRWRSGSAVVWSIAALLCGTRAGVAWGSDDLCSFWTVGVGTGGASAVASSGTTAILAGNCSGCVASPGCGFCLQTLTCAPLAESLFSCRDSVALAPGECAAAGADEGSGALACAGAVNCTSCLLPDGMCAWCGDLGMCMAASDAAALGCSGALYTAPCSANDNPVGTAASAPVTNFATPGT